jgi:steroid delta-isomerase-like uncharacterized protein
VTTEGNKALFRRLVEEVVNRGDLDRAGEFVGADFVDHYSALGRAAGVEGFQHGVRTLRAAFPDLSIAVEQMVAEGDLVCARIAVRGTHKGEFAGLPPTSNAVEYPGIGILRVQGGKIAERCRQSDVPSLMRQFGAAPPSGPVAAGSGR